MQIFLAIVNKNTYICANKKLITMVSIIEKGLWERLGDMVRASRELEQALVDKGFEVINTFSTGIQKACITFIVKRNHVEVFSACVLDAITEEERVKREIFERGEELLNTDLDAIERDALLARLAELDNRQKPSCGR